jgi:hypothetical protein
MDFGHQRHGRGARGCASGWAAARFRHQARDLGPQRGGFAQQPRCRRGIGCLAPNDSFRVIADPAMKGGKLGRQPQMPVGCDQQVVDAGDGGDSQRNGGPALHTEVEDVIRRVDHLNGDERHCVPGEHRSVGAEAVRQGRHIDAKTDPYGERQEEQIPCLRKASNKGDRCDHADHRSEKSEGGLLNACPRVRTARIPTVMAADNGD